MTNIICSTYCFVFASENGFENNCLLCSKTTPLNYANTTKSVKASVIEKCRLLTKMQLV